MRSSQAPHPFASAAILTGALILVPALAVTAPAAAASAPALSPDDQALVQTATDYLQGLKTVSGRFTQISANGAASAGVFYMQRPGKARFQYDPPAQMLVVADGYNVSIYDGRLKSFDQYPLGQTPLVLLLGRQVRFDRGVVVSEVNRTEEGFSITARDARKQAEGRITLYFGGDPLALKGWTVIDAQGQETRVHLGALTPASSLDPALFVLRNPRAASGRP